MSYTAKSIKHKQFLICYISHYVIMLFYHMHRKTTHWPQAVWDS